MIGETMDNHQLLALALRAGASLAGIANADMLRLSPSHRDTGQQTLPAATRSVLVIALHHPAARPELDYWGGTGSTRGNLSLIQMATNIARQAEADLGICATPLNYQATNQGTFLKDAAILAGMGVMGRNNLLITPEYGPRVRLKALTLDIEVQPTECRPGFDPCASCAMPCRTICPQAAFATNRYDCLLCRIQMRSDEATPLKHADADGYTVAYCRACELACPVGQTESDHPLQQ
jgi:epoxyqueuosine reductase